METNETSIHSLVAVDSVAGAAKHEWLHEGTLWPSGVVYDALGMRHSQRAPLRSLWKQKHKEVSYWLSRVLLKERLVNKLPQYVMQTFDFDL